MPDDFFRIRLVATLLETCGIFFNRGASGKKLDYFLSFLQVRTKYHVNRGEADSAQYYIYTKDPLPMDIEFIVQDVFALTRPQWKLASNLEEASRAFQLAMAQDQKTSGMDKAAEPEDPDSDGSSDDGIGDNDAETGLPEADAEEDSESDEDVDVSSNRELFVSVIETNSTNQAELNGDLVLSAPGTDSEEEAIVVTREEEEVDPEDEADFEREYAKMMAESLDSRKHERKSTFDVPLPIRRKDANASGDLPDETVNSSAAPAGTMAFSLLTKRGNRQQVRCTNLVFGRLF